MSFTGVTIMVGGRSTEHDASLHSYRNLRAQMLTAQSEPGLTVFIGREGSARVYEGVPDVAVLGEGSGLLVDPGELVNTLVHSSHVFSLLHGTEGEDGAWQGVAEVFDVCGNFGPTGAAALTMDKLACAAVVALLEPRIRTPRTFPIPTSSPAHAVEAACDSLNGAPCVIKPNSMGASLLTAHLKNPSKDALCSLAVEAADFERRMLVQEFIQGSEYTVGVLELGSGVCVLPPARAASSGEILGFAEKHRADSVVSVSWPDPGQGVAKLLVDVSERLFGALGLHLCARFDFVVEESSEDIFFLECNAMPGLGEGSIFPLMLERAGFNLLDLLASSIETRSKRPAKCKVFPYDIEGHEVFSA